MNHLISRILTGWNRFWFEPQSTAPLAVFRIAFGLVATLWTASLWRDLFILFGPDGIMPKPTPMHPGTWGLLFLYPGRPAITILFVMTFVGAIALTVGFRTRLAAVVVFLGILSFNRDNPLVLNSGDDLLRILALYCALSPAGAALSLDRLRTNPDRFWESPRRAPWALRLIQIQLSIIYLSAFAHKISGEQWRNGTAVSYALRIEDMHRFPTPSFITHSVTITEILTYGTLIVELALGLLIWNRSTRPWVLGLGVLLHLSIEYSIEVGFFSWTILTAYLAFIPAHTVNRYALALRGRLRGRTVSAGGHSLGQLPAR
ncbi:HTTM domain-containing protein [Pseudonocardia spinosispora]|uniref:HTTM domain-containing protein n=1 Tax=Pseudonocardia spinosispora TaxID=103441 RepID=UPI000A01C994|nr:HTTM domain-containing protein [Pseudonocardia spinosispora]